MIKRVQKRSFSEEPLLDAEFSPLDVDREPFQLSRNDSSEDPLDMQRKMVNRKINLAWTWWIWGGRIMNTGCRESKTQMRMKMNGWTIDESIEEVSTSKKFYIKG